MYRTKYVVAGKWVNNENNKDTFPITAENIKILVRDSNYEKENLTKGMLRLMLDKNFMDYLYYWNEKYYRNGFVDGSQLVIGCFEE